MDRLCHHSPLFASSMLTIFRNLIESLSTNMQTKLKLIRILRHMTHNAVMVKQVRSFVYREMASCLCTIPQQTQEVCIEMLQRYPSTSFVVHLLQTLTLLADKSKLELQYTVSRILINFLCYATDSYRYHRSICSPLMRAMTCVWPFDALHCDRSRRWQNTTLLHTTSTCQIWPML